MPKEKQENLWEQVTSQQALQAAWYRVEGNDGSAGGDGVSLKNFGRDLFANLTQLRAELLQGSYRSGPFRKVSIPKRKPGYRILTIPSIRDRVLHTSIANALTPIFEPLFEESSFATAPIVASPRPLSALNNGTDGVSISSSRRISLATLTI